MKIIIFTIACFFFAFGLKAQVINFTPNANTIIVSTNTTVGIGGGNFKTYLVCPGVTLSYAENSSMDTILLESGATLKFDSAYSYGYAAIYAKAGSSIDMNFKQTGKLTFVNGVTVIDSNVGPPSFFMGTNLVTTINYIYSNLPGGVGCAPNALQELSPDEALLSIHNNEHELIIRASDAVDEPEIIVCNISGQRLVVKKLHEQKSTVGISHLPKGIYRLLWSDHKHSGSISFSK